MNSRDYQKHMSKHGLIESIDSVHSLVNAVRLNDNIKSIKKVMKESGDSQDSYALDPQELIDELNQQKDQHIKLAIRYAHKKDWALEMFGGVYTEQIKELLQNFEPTVAALGELDIKQQMGVE